jgi:hypothetical protein
MDMDVVRVGSVATKPKRTVGAAAAPGMGGGKELLVFVLGVVALYLLVRPLIRPLHQLYLRFVLFSSLSSPGREGLGYGETRVRERNCRRAVGDEAAAAAARRGKARRWRRGAEHSGVARGGGGLRGRPSRSARGRKRRWSGQGYCNVRQSGPIT